MAIGVSYDFDKMETGDFDGVITPEKVADTPQSEPTNESEPTPPPTPEPQQEETPTPEPQAEPEQKPEQENNDVGSPTPVVDKEAEILNFLNKKSNTSFKTIEEYNQSLTKEIEKEVVKEVQPEYDEETQKFLNFKKETGRGMQDWIKLNENHDNKSDMQLAFDKIKNDNKGINLNTEDLRILLSQELGVDTEDLDDLEHKDKLRLKVLANTFKNELKAEQEKYLTPLEKTEKPTEKSQPNGETITIGGQQISKEEHQKLREEYLQSSSQAVSELKGVEIDLVISDATGNKTHKLNYDFTDPDKQEMLAGSNDLDKLLLPYINEEGGLKHKELNQALFFGNPKNWEKVQKSMVQQAYSLGVNSVLKEERNIDFTTNPKPTEPKAKNGYGEVGVRPSGGFSVKFPFNP
ncbi:hypothetical protein [Aquimarina algiphila]|uniref:Uncharacterized protein n=1 Tax=Aquimarina algiphila TaxID=2047982 RepID=A0A554VRM8_9FLAO|nr:hypothetical protein [Aquimarina algiphila]TSE11278.1 hypothetical protein FOF46_01220 [Aquimarina algiphila]